MSDIEFFLSLFNHKKEWICNVMLYFANQTVSKYIFHKDKKKYNITMKYDMTCWDTQLLLYCMTYEYYDRYLVICIPWLLLSRIKYIFMWLLVTIRHEISPIP